MNPCDPLCLGSCCLLPVWALFWAFVCGSAFASILFVWLVDDALGWVAELGVGQAKGFVVEVDGLKGSCQSLALNPRLCPLICCWLLLCLLLFPSPRKSVSWGIRRHNHRRKCSERHVAFILHRCCLILPTNMTCQLDLNRSKRRFENMFLDPATPQMLNDEFSGLLQSIQGGNFGGTSWVFLGPHDTTPKLREKFRAFVGELVWNSKSHLFC